MASGAPVDELGTLAFGSTVVLLGGGPRSSAWKPCRIEGTVNVGERLGVFGLPRSSLIAFPAVILEVWTCEDGNRSNPIPWRAPR